MGDWVAAQQLADKVPDTAYTYWPAPGTAGNFQFLADSFTLPTNGADPEGAKCWLKTVGSAEGQKAFNTKKGSIPARSDAIPADYPKYQQAAMADWKTDKIVPSCAHGAACTPRPEQRHPVRAQPVQRRPGRREAADRHSVTAMKTS